MGRKRIFERRGVTLLELTFAMAVFAIALGATAHTLFSYYGLLNLQDRRAVALQHCRSVIGAVREIRDRSGADYIDAITAWIAEQEAGQGEESTGYADLIASPLPGETINTVCSSLWTGGPAEDPMQVTVTSTFTDLRGREITVQLGTVLTRS